MIGCARKKGKYICIDQFFAEKPSEEKLIISAFIEILKKYNNYDNIVYKKDKKVVKCSHI